MRRFDSAKCFKMIKYSINPEIKDRKIESIRMNELYVFNCYNKDGKKIKEISISEVIEILNERFK